MNKRFVALTTFGLGVGITYLADPSEGRRRRARLREVLAHASHTLNAVADMTSRDVEHRLTGLAVRTLVRLVGARTPSDLVLVARVRSHLGRLVSHPGAIDVTASDGVITVSGPVFEAEVRQLLKHVRAVRGVTAVENRLDPHRQAESLPALQGPGPLRVSRAPRWTPAGRLMAGVAGLALVAASTARRTARGAAAGLAGIGLLERALLGTRSGA